MSRTTASTAVTTCRHDTTDQVDEGTHPSQVEVQDVRDATTAVTGVEDVRR
jgi:hypothetical protein